MIKVNELRIGNIVSNGESVVVKLFMLYTGLDEFYVDYDPIELNEDWLLKFGFIESNNTEFHTYDKDKLSIHLKSKQYANGRTYFNSWCIIEKQIKHVHQLQNLYFALTGEELSLQY